MKKILSILLTFTMIFGMFNVNVFAAEVPIQEEEIKTMIVDMDDVMTMAASTSKTKNLLKDMATTSGTGKVVSIGQIVDFSTLIPAGSKIVSITMYCPTSVRFSTSTYTAVENWIVKTPQASCIIPFVRTNTPTFSCKSVALAGKDANVKFTVSIQGTVMQNQTGFDGFTVFGGAKMIVEYK